MLTGAKINAVRTKTGDNQAAFAKRLGVNQSTISRWEMGRLPRRAIERVTVERLLDEVATVEATG